MHQADSISTNALVQSIKRNSFWVLPHETNCWCLLVNFPSCPQIEGKARLYSEVCVEQMTHSHVYWQKDKWQKDTSCLLDTHCQWLKNKIKVDLKLDGLYLIKWNDDFTICNVPDTSIKIIELHEGTICTIYTKAQYARYALYAKYARYAWYLNQGRPHLPRFRISRVATSCKCPRWTLFWRGKRDFSDV